MSKKIGSRFSLMVRPKDGVTYVIRTNAERVEVPAEAASTTFSGDYYFFKRSGEQETPATFYCFIFARASNGTRRRVFRVTSKVSSVQGLSITVNASDAALEVYVYDELPASNQAALTDYTAKKEIPVEKVAGTLRCRWAVAGVEQAVLSSKYDGTPRGDFPTQASMTVSLMVRSANGTENVLTDTGSLTIFLMGTGTSYQQAFTDAAMTYTLQVSGSALSVLTQCTGLRAVWTTSKFGTVEFTLPKVFDGARGYSGPVPIPAGKWTNTGTFTATTSQAQYVWNEYDNNFYIVKAPETGTNTATIGTRPDQNLTQWTRINRMEPLFTDLAIIQGGTVGRAVFWDEFMFSQYGRHSDGTVVDEDGGTYGAPVQATDAGGTFQPNFLINFLTGETVQRKATIEGTLRARILAHSFVRATSSNGTYANSVLLPSQNLQGTFVWLTSANVNWSSLWEVDSNVLPSKLSLYRNADVGTQGYTRLTMPPAEDFLGQEIEIFSDPQSYELHIGGGSSSSGNLYDASFGTGKIVVLAPRTTWASYGVEPNVQSSVRLLAVAIDDGATPTYGWMVMGCQNCVVTSRDTP